MGFSHALWWFRISRAVGREDYVRVVELAEERLRRNPEDLAALHLAALNLEALGLPDRALGFAERALLLDPDAFDLHCQRVRLLDPIQDRTRLEETARWLIALSQTTEPERNQDRERWLQRLHSLPTPQRWKDTARDELDRDRWDQTWYLDWARDLLAKERP
jgi:tetratricopeptide (TPR) repeat protein